MSKKSQGMHYRISLGGQPTTLYYDQNLLCFPVYGRAVAWKDERDNKVHYFWFKLGGSWFVLRVKYRPNLGLDTTLVRLENQGTLETVKNTFRTSKGRKFIGGNLSLDPFMYDQSVECRLGQFGIFMTVSSFSDDSHDFVAGEKGMYGIVI